MFRVTQLARAFVRDTRQFQTAGKALAKPECYLMKAPLFSEEQFKAIQGELSLLEAIPYENDLFRRSFLNIRKDRTHDLRFYPVTFSSGKLMQWRSLQRQLIDNTTIQKAIETALNRFGQEHSLDGEEHFFTSIIKYSIPRLCHEGGWHSDYATKWSMIAMLSDPSEWKGGRLLFSKGEPHNNRLIQKTDYVKNRALMFYNDHDNNYHALERMVAPKPVDRVILVLFQLETHPFPKFDVMEPSS